MLNCKTQSTVDLENQQKQNVLVKIHILAKLQNTGPLTYMSLNHKGAYCVFFKRF